MLSGKERLALVRELSGLRSDISGTLSGMAKMKIVRRITEIRVLLTGRAEVTADDVDINDQEAIDRFVMAEIERLGDDLTHADYTSALMLVSPYLRHGYIKEPDADTTIQEFESFSSVGGGLLPENMDEMLSADASEGEKSNIANARRDILDAFWKEPELTEKFIAFKQSVSAKVEETREALDAVSEEFYKKKPNDWYWTQEYREWESAFNAVKKPFKTRYTRAYNEREALVEAWKQEQIKSRLDEIDALSAKLFEPGRAVIDAVISKSPITPEQADAYASQQVIDSGVKTSLAKIDYPEEKLRADIAEFYRMTGGKVAPLRIRHGSYGGGRASAQNHGDDDLATIQVGQGFNKKTLWHEMGHCVEYGDDSARHAAYGFLKKRRESDKLFKLNQLTGQSGRYGYKPDEVAYKDKFFHPYVGKYYSHGTTEVISMGFECLSSPEKAAKLAHEDKEHLALVMGYMAQDMRPLQKLRLRKSNDKKADVIDKAKTREELVSGVIGYGKKIAKTLDKTHKLDGDLRTAFEFGLVGGNFHRKSFNDKPDFIGRVGNFHVYKGKMRNWNTRRVGSGYFMTTVPDGMYAVPAGGDRFNIGGDTASRVVKNVYGGDDGFYAILALHEYGRKGGIDSRFLNTNDPFGGSASSNIISSSTELLQECYDWLKANYGK